VWSIGLSLLSMGAAACEIPDTSLGTQTAAGDGLQTGQAALSVYTDPKGGNLSLTGLAASAWIPNEQGVWSDVPGLGTVIRAQAGDNIQINVDAEVKSTANVWFRALIDGAAALPTDVVFKLAGDAFDGPHQFSFIQTGLAVGPHIVTVQWLTNAGTAASVKARSLSVNTGQSAKGAEGRLAVASPASGPDITKSNNTITAVPGLSTSITLPVSSNLDIVVSAEAQAAAGRLFLVGVVDGVALSDAMVETPANSGDQGTRSFRFVKNGVAAGAHTVGISWYADAAGGMVSLGDRALSVYSAPAAGSDASLKATNLQTAPTVFTSSSYVDVPGIAQTVTTASGNVGLEIAFTAEVWASSGQLFVRALVDGNASTDLTDLVLINSGTAQRAAGRLFTQRGLSAGSHTIKVQARTSSGGSASIGDRTLAVTVKRRTGGDFARFFAGDDGLSPSPKQGGVPLLFICIDPQRPGVPRPTQAQVTQYLQGGDGLPNVSSYYAEITGGHYGFSSVTYLGCGSPVYLSPPAHQGTWYWDNSDFHQRWVDGLQAADPSFDFHQFDRNKDNSITGDELAIMIASPQNDSWGTFQTGSVTLAVDGISTPLTFDFTDLYVSADATKRVTTVGTIAHELAHHLIRADDEYGDPNFPDPIDPGSSSLMAWQGDATHIDPFTEMKSGWLDVDLVDGSSWPARRRLSIDPTTPSRAVTLLYDPAKGEKEYYLMENRAGGYDSALVPQGLHVWHIVEDFATAVADPPPGMTSAEWSNVPQGWGRMSVRLLYNANRGGLAAGNTTKLLWADGSPSGFRITPVTLAGGTISVDVDKTTQTFASSVSPPTMNQYGPFTVLPGESLVATLTGTGGDADLYVRQGAPPTTDFFDCRPFTITSNEQCTVTNGSGAPSDMYVGINGFSGTVTYSLVADFSR
jgi:M6 family metalloprotease-like protein